LALSLGVSFEAGTEGRGD